MRKYIIGILIGFSLSAVVGVNAEEIISSIIGKTVQGSFPVKIDGKQIIEQAAVIDGTSYLPVREIGEALNKDVTFDANLGIELKSKAGVNVNPPKAMIIPETKLDDKTSDLTQQLAPILTRFLELETILKDYRDGTKGKDKVYEDAIKENDELKLKYNEISDKIKALQAQQ
jgi:hypothetical protein